jgi:NADH dehydrogenase/NADH:ubiquinone oxidoreductase subunit G
MVNLFINDIQVEVPQKTTILQACDTVGIDIPRVCFHERL